MAGLEKVEAGEAMAAYKMKGYPGRADLESVQKRLDEIRTWLGSE